MTTSPSTLPLLYMQLFLLLKQNGFSLLLEIHYTPKHGSWLNMAEIELSVLTRQCLDRPIPDIESLKREVSAWESRRNAQHSRIDWQFTTEDAPIKLKRLYPSIIP